jgi:hypothetical protein
VAHAPAIQKAESSKNGIKGQPRPKKKKSKETLSHGRGMVGPLNCDPSYKEGIDRRIMVQGQSSAKM